ncbi:UNVERIFIED_ORG: hypothetical protein E4P37_18165 [Bacillus sp. AZ43]
MSAEAVVGLVLLAVGLLVFAWHVRRTHLLGQADLLRTYTDDFFSDQRLTGLLMDVDRGRFVFSEKDLGNQKELALVRLLDLLNLLGHAWHRGAVDLRDIAPTTLGYATVRLHANRHVTWYLAQVEGWNTERYSPGSGFGYFRELAAALATYPLPRQNASLMSRATTAFVANRQARRPVRAATTLRPPRSVAATADEVAGSD